MPSLLLRRRTSSSASRRSSMSRTLASASALARALRSSSVSVRRTTPEALRGAAGGAAAGRASGAALAGAAGAALATTGSGACVSVAGPSPPMRRLPRFSTTTCLVRPWLKLCFTVPVSTRGLSVKVLFGTLSFLSPGVLSTIQQVLILLRRACPHSLYRRILVSQVLGRVAGCLVVVRHPVSDQDMAARQERFARRAREQGCMYHI